MTKLTGWNGNPVLVRLEQVIAVDSHPKGGSILVFNGATVQVQESQDVLYRLIKEATR